MFLSVKMTTLHGALSGIASLSLQKELRNTICLYFHLLVIFKIDYNWYENSDVRYLINIKKVKNKKNLLVVFTRMLAARKTL